MESTLHPTQIAILEEALANFGEHGYEGTSFKTIADAIGRPPSLVVYHFATKENLYLETFKYLFEIYPFRAVPPIHLEDLPTSERHAAAFACLEGQVRQLAREVLPDAACQDSRRNLGAKLWMRELQFPRPVLHDLIHLQLAAFVSSIRECMRILHPEKPAAEVDFLGAALVGNIVGHTTMFGLNQIIWGGEYSRLPRSRMIELILDACLRGFVTPAGAGGGLTEHGWS